MAAIIKKLLQGYAILFEELPDPRTKEWLFVAKPYQTLIVIGLYLMTVLKWGPKWMKNRPAFNLDKVLIVYNAAQVIACSYIFFQAVYHAWGWDYKWICEPVDYSFTPKALWLARLTYYYFLLKLVDLLDTVFFVLRKKFNQVSFLHLYHHTGMVLLIWAAVTYLPGGHGTFVGVINSFVHAVMYAYYLLTVIKPSYKQSFWWKKYITQLQILQFFWCVVHMGYVVFEPDCAYPRWISAVFLPQNLFMLVMFIDFYIKAYVRKPIVKADKDRNNCNEYTADKINSISSYNKDNNRICKGFEFKDVIKCNFNDDDKGSDILYRSHKLENGH